MHSTKDVLAELTRQYSWLVQLAESNGGPDCRLAKFARSKHRKLARQLAKRDGLDKPLGLGQPARQG